jgi:hypothetical protein
MVSLTSFFKDCTRTYQVIKRRIKTNLDIAQRETDAIFVAGHARTILDPFPANIQWDGYSCAVCCGLMVIKYMTDRKPARSSFRRDCDGDEDGTTFEGLARGLRTRGVKARHIRKRPTVAQLCAYIDDGRPVIVSVRKGSVSHAVVCIGYLDESPSTLIIRDPSYWGKTTTIRHLQHEFIAVAW